jgi:hypothetical protein
MTKTQTTTEFEAHGTIVMADGTARPARMWRGAGARRVDYARRGGRLLNITATPRQAATFQLDPQQAAWLHEQAIAEDDARESAAVTAYWQNTGHELIAAEIEDAHAEALAEDAAREAEHHAVTGETIRETKERLYGSETTREAARPTDDFPLYVERTKQGDWNMRTPEALTDEQAMRITFRADPRTVVLGAYVAVHDAGGTRAGHLSGATYHERWNGPAYVVCAITLR